MSIVANSLGMVKSCSGHFDTKEEGTLGPAEYGGHDVFQRFTSLGLGQNWP